MFKYNFEINLALCSLFLLSTILLIFLMIRVWGNKTLTKYAKEQKTFHLIIPLFWTIILSTILIISLCSFSACPNCEELVSTDYCIFCGELIPGHVKPVKSICPNCNIIVNTPFCGQCGTKIN